MKTTICNKCGQVCDVIFRRYYTTKDGTKVFPQKAKCFPIPVCDCSKNKS